MFDVLKQRGPNWWIPWTFVGFFAVMLVANGTMLYFAIVSWTGVETNNAYRRGLQYNEKLDAAARQRALGWTAQVAVEQGESLQARITLALSDAESQPLDGASVAATFVRPTHAGSDFGAALNQTGAGRYEAAVAFPLAGQWDVRMDVTHDGDTYAMKERVYLRP